jgi:DNA-binding NarL/FixJ family response regulator
MIHLHVLLVADAIGTRHTVKAALAIDPFFTVHDCASGAEAMPAAIAWPADLILLDEAMCGDGLTVLARLRADKRAAPIPVVVLTVKRGAGERRRLQALGAAGVICKPFDAKRLAAGIRSFVAVEGVLSPAREGFLRRLKDDASALSTWRQRLTQTPSEVALKRINEIAHSLAGAGGIYGFAGISSASTALSNAAEDNLAGRAKPIEVERALNRLLARIA